MPESSLNGLSSSESWIMWKSDSNEFLFDDRRRNSGLGLGISILTELIVGTGFEFLCLERVSTIPPKFSFNFFKDFYRFMREVSFFFKIQICVAAQDTSILIRASCRAHWSNSRRQRILIGWNSIITFTKLAFDLVLTMTHYDSFSFWLFWTLNYSFSYYNYS